MEWGSIGTYGLIHMLLYLATLHITFASFNAANQPPATILVVILTISQFFCMYILVVFKIRVKFPSLFFKTFQSVTIQNWVWLSKKVEKG